MEAPPRRPPRETRVARARLSRTDADRRNESALYFLPRTRRATRHLPRGGTRGRTRSAGSSGPARPVRSESESSFRDARSRRASGHAMSPVVRRGRGGRLRGRRRATATAIDSGPSRHRPRFVHAGSGSDCGSSSCRGAARGGGTRGHARRPTSTARRRPTRRRARGSKCRGASGSRCAKSTTCTRYVKRIAQTTRADERRRPRRSRRD